MARGSGAAYPPGWVSLELVILGIGSAFSARSWGSSAAVRHPSGFILIDCPDPIFHVLTDGAAASQWNLHPDTVTDLLLTHLHGDHCNGLEALGFHRWLRHLGAGLPLPNLYTLPGVAARLWERLAPAMDRGGEGRLADYFRLCPLEPGQRAMIGDIQAECRPANHGLPATSWRLRRGKVSLGWSGDTAFDRALIDWLAEADLVVHETSPPPTHTSLSELHSLPESVRRKIRLTHMPDDFDPKTTSLVPLHQGEMLLVGG